MLSHRQQYRILLTAVVFALIAVAFFAAYQGVRHWDESHGLSILIGKKGHPRPFSADWFMEDPVAFATLDQVQAGPIDIRKRYRHYDWLAPGHENAKQLDIIEIPDFQNVVFGGFWYLDFQKQEHRFRFILTIDEGNTFPDIADLVDAS